VRQEGLRQRKIAMTLLFLCSSVYSTRKIKAAFEPLNLLKAVVSSSKDRCD